MQIPKELKTPLEKIFKMIQELIIRPIDGEFRGLEHIKTLRNGVEVYALRIRDGSAKIPVLTLKLPSGAVVVLDEYAVIASVSSGVMIDNDYCIVELPECSIRARNKSTSDLAARDLTIRCGDSEAETKVEIPLKEE